MIRTVPLPQIVGVGANGSATGTSTSARPLSGALKAIKVVQGATPAATTDITITLSNGATTVTLLTITNSNTASKWYYPRALAQGTDGADLTGWYGELPLDGYVTAAMAQGNSGATLDVTLQYGDE